MTRQIGKLRRFLCVLGLLPACMTVPAFAFLIGFLLWLVLWQDMHPFFLVPGAFIATAVFAVILAVYQGFLTRWCFFYPGEGEPVSEDELRAILLSINEFDAPMSVEDQGEKFVVTWKYNDAKWWELLAKASPKRLYELHVRLNDRRKEAVLVDVHKIVDWGAGPTDVNAGRILHFGAFVDCRFGSQCRVEQTFEAGKAYDFKFKPGEIKNAVMNSILRSGWAVRFGMW